MSNLDLLFDFFTKDHFAAIAVWVFLGYFLAKVYDIFFHKKLMSKVYLKSCEDKITYFVVFFIGLILLLLTFIIDLFYKASFIWYVISIAEIIGGALGLLPFNFPKKK